jgi:hypothetical protein
MKGNNILYEVSNVIKYLLGNICAYIGDLFQIWGTFKSDVVPTPVCRIL